MNSTLRVKHVALPDGRASDTKILIDEIALLFYDRLQHWKGGDRKFMSSNHSEVAET